MVEHLQLLGDARLCIASYDPVERFQEEGTVTFIENDMAQAYTVRATDRTLLHVVFRGTDQLQDAMLGANTRLSPLMFDSVPAGRVHSGFLSYYARIRSRILDDIRAFVDQGGVEVRFTGHSLGGCVVYAALEATFVCPGARVSCSTFGSPKMGDAEFCRLFRERVGQSVRIVNRNDVVCSFPVFNDDYHHVHDALSLNNFESPLGISWTYVCMWRVYWKLYWKLLLNTLDFHSLHTYVEGLQRIGRSRT